MALDPSCSAFQAAVGILARPWNARLLTLLQRRALRFTELTQGLPGIGDKILSARLKQLEATALVVRRVHPGPPIRAEYALTRKGRAFRKLAAAIQRWGHELVDGGPSEGGGDRTRPS